MGSSSSAFSEREPPLPSHEGAGSVASGSYVNRELACDERHEHWRSRLAGSFDIPVPEQPDEYLIETRRWMVPGMLLVSGSYPGMQMVRTRHHIQRDQYDHYVVTVPRSGPMRIDAEGTQRLPDSMQPVLTDMSRPSTLTWKRGDNFTIFARRDELDALLPRALDLHGVAPRGIAAALLANHFVTLERHLPNLSTPEAVGVKASTLHLLAASLAPSINSLGLARPAIDLGLTRMIRQCIEKQLRDPELSTGSLCRQFHVSRSTLYRLMEPLGGVARYIRERRLAQCHVILSTPGPRLYIERVAHEHGFSTASQFSRAFHEQFGYAPREALHHLAPYGRFGPKEQTGMTDFRAGLEALGR
jgi:AraC-like DNA-binding protein